MRTTHSEIASLRREQIIEAAVAVITEQGLHNLSLSEIETRAGMSRGQLTYYFPTKEAILLAVFDRLLALMYQQIGKPEGPSAASCQAGGWELIQHLFRAMLSGPPVSPEFHCLEYTFLSQIGYREDFRQRLATLYEEWRTHMAQGLTDDLAAGTLTRPIPARTMATFIQAVLHGLALQAAADPQAFDREAMLQLCLELLGKVFGVVPAPSHDDPAGNASAPASAKTRQARQQADLLTTEE